MNNRIFLIIKSTFFTLVLIYFFLAAWYYISRSGLSGGDENLFISDLNYIKSNDWIEAIKKNISIPYMILAYPFSLFMENYMALRLVNIILIILFFLYLIRQNLKIKKSGYFYLAFFISATGYFYYGTNDTLFFLSLSIFLYEAYKASINKNFNLNFALSALVIAVFTREVIIIYLPVILIGLFVFIKKGARFSSYNFIPVSLLVIFFIFNIPSLQQNGRLSHDKKSPPKAVTATWSQRQYLAQLKVNNNELEFQSHPSWEETDNYLRKHGDNALPKSYFDGLTHDINITIKEFGKDLIYIIIYHSRLIGLILFISIFIALKEYLKGRSKIFELFAPFTILLMIFIFSLIIISFVEMRWLAPVFILSILFYTNMEKNKKIPQAVISLNMIVLTFLACYGSLGIITKLLLI